MGVGVPVPDELDGAEATALSGGAEPLVSIVVPVRGRRQELRRLLDSVARQRADLSGVEVIVVENGERTHDQWILSGPWGFSCRYRCVQRGAQALARNVGAAMASSPVLVFLDSDVVLEKGALDQLLRDWSTAPGMCSWPTSWRHLRSSGRWRRGCSTCRPTSSSSTARA